MSIMDAIILVIFLLVILTSPLWFPDILINCISRLKDLRHTKDKDE